MFDHILVAEELLPVRTAASQGDIDAMFSLAKHIVEGKHTARSGKQANWIVNRMFFHEDFRKNPRRAWDTYVMTVNVYRLLYLEGNMSHRQYIEESCDYLQMMIDCMTTAPRQMWNYRQLENCIAWIREHEPKLQKEAL